MSANTPALAVSAPEVCPTYPTVAPRQNAIRRVAPYLLPVGTAAIYLLFPTKNYYWDGITFATAIESSQGFTPSLIHPHHLLYNAFGWLLYSLARSEGWQIRAVTLLQITNCVISVFCALLLFRFLKHTLTSSWIATVSILAFSFSATWWKYSTDADSYVLSVFFLLVCLNLLLASKKPRPFWLALTHTASMLMHQLAVFFFPAMVVGILMRSEYSYRRRVSWALQYSASATILTLGINYYCFHWATGAFGLGPFARWLTHYLQPSSGYSFSFNLLSNFGYTLRGQARLFFEGRLGWTKGLLSLPLIALLVLLVLVIGTLFVRWAQDLRWQRPRLQAPAFFTGESKSIAVVCFVWLASYQLFLFFWYPYFTPYRLFYLAPVVILFGTYLARKENALGRRPMNALLFVVAMAISNFAFFIFPLTHVEKSPPLSFALELNQTLTPDSVIFYAQSNADIELLRYFNPNATWRAFSFNDASTFDTALNEASRTNHNVWLESTAIKQFQSSTQGAAWLRDHSSPNCVKELIDRSYRMKLIQVFPVSTATQPNCGATASHESSRE